jgi:hypothetical protein
MRFLPVAATAAALPLLVTACSFGSGTSPSKPTGATSAANPDAGLLTGSQLQGMLAPSSWFPPGFTLDSTNSVNTGSTYEPASPKAGAPDCARLSATGWIGLAGPGPVSFAQNDYINQDTTEEYAQEIDVYPGVSAQTAMAGLRKLATTCPHFDDTQTHSTVTVKLRKGPRLGDDSLTFRLDSPRWQGGTSLEAVRVGTAIITVVYSGASGTGTAQATKLATAITKKLERA